MSQANYFCGSPTVFANLQVEQNMRQAATKNKALYLPAGALWGSSDIQKMAARGSFRYDRRLKNETKDDFHPCFSKMKEGAIFWCTNL